MKVLGPDTSDLKIWNEKLLSVMAQCFGKKWRTFMLELDRSLDVRQKVLDDAGLDMF